MYRPRQQAPAPRRGIVLLVVLALLTLFAIIGISFVLYANSEAKTSQYFRESEAPPQPDMDPELLLSMFLGQVIYDVDDDTGIYSAMRGHSLARNMYGYYYARPGTNDPGNLNIYAFNGTGRLRGGQWPAAWTTRISPLPDMAPAPAVYDDYYQVSYQALDPTYIHDPERPGWRKRTDPKLPYQGGLNPPYTYPDLNNMFLAAVKAGPLEQSNLNPKVYLGSEGAVLIQSFHRPWLFGPLYNPNNPNNHYDNSNWTKDLGKYMILRPRPVDMGPGFPYPEDAGGDVKNLVNSPGYFMGIQNGKPVFANNDSIWIDLGAPVMTAPDGTKFKPLFAPLIIDLDNRINVNVHGNVRGKMVTHASNQGWGPWEVSLAQILNFGTPQPLNEWTNLFTDLYDPSKTTPIESGRYAGPAPLSTYPAANTAEDGTPPHFWNPVDFDASDELLGGGPSDPLVNAAALNGFPGVRNPPNTGPWYCPSFPATPKGYGNGSQAERQNHPLVYNFFNPYQDPSNASRRNLVFPISNMEALLRYGETNSPGLTSSLFRLCAANFSDPANGAKRRGLVTTHSFGLDRPGVSPWWWYNNDGNSILSMAESSYDPLQPDTILVQPPLPKSSKVPFPPLNTPAKQLQTDFFTSGGGANLQTDWRSLGAVLNKLDLNRRLTPYPITTARLGNFDARNNPVVPFPGDVNNRQYQQARDERIQFAQDILQRLMVATRAYDPQHPPVDNTGKKVQATADHIRAVAYLAQLAVNIVDFIDSDDIMTGLDWLSYVDPNNTEFTKAATKLGYSGKNQYVWGVELPRVLLNEVYAEYTLQAGQHANDPMATYQVDVWVELYNPLNDQVLNPSGTYDTQAADPTQGYTYLRLPLANEGAYRLELMNSLKSVSTNNIHLSTNPTGDPDPTQLFTSPSGQLCRVNQFQPAGRANVPIQDFIAPAGGVYNPVLLDRRQNGGNLGFYVLGAERAFPHEGKGKDVTPFLPVATQKDPAMSYLSHAQDRVSSTNNQQYPKPDSDPTCGPTVVLQRLANPYLPWNDITNPYVTIDFIERIVPNNALSQADDPTGYTPIAQRTAWAKKDPFDSLRTTTIASNGVARVGKPGAQMALMPPNQHQPQHTFFRHNGLGPNGPSNPDGTDTFLVPFNWLPHPDRQLISPMELLTVPGVKAAEITQRFPMQFGTPVTYPKHFAPWFIKPDENRLFRFFEFVETNNRATGVARGGRIPGLVNLNTVWDPEILMALCDPQNGNFTGDPSNKLSPTAFFSDLNVYRSLAPGVGGGENINAPTSSFWRMMKARSPSLVVDGQGPSYKDRPFLGHAPGVTPDTGDVQHPLGGTGANDTLFRTDRAGGAPIFMPSSYSQAQGNRIHPYIGSQLMTKLFNNVTTRSNVFAVWVTVGFFQVVQDTDANGQPIRPVKLGAEIGKAEGRNIRHRMFAIVDRSNLTIDNQPGTFQTGPPIFLEAKLEANTTVPINGVRTEVPVYSISGAQYNTAGNTHTLSGSYEGIPWTITGSLNAPSTWVQTEPLVGLRTNQIQDQFRKVIAVNPPGKTFVTPLGQRITVKSPTVTLQGLLGAGTTSPMYLMPLPGNTATPFRLGNPGPKPGFNMRNYPSIVRYFSIIH